MTPSSTIWLRDRLEPIVLRAQEKNQAICELAHRIAREHPGYVSRLGDAKSVFYNEVDLALARIHCPQRIRMTALMLTRESVLDEKRCRRL